MIEEPYPKTGPESGPPIRTFVEALLIADGIDPESRIFPVLVEWEEQMIELAISRRRYAGAPNYPHLMVRSYPGGAQPPLRWSPEHEQYPVSCSHCGESASVEALFRNCPVRLSMISA